MQKFYIRPLFLVCLVFAFVFKTTALNAQCGEGLSELVISIIPDSYPNEINWNVTTNEGIVLATGGAQGTTLCVEPGLCLAFEITDSANDGICCGYGIGSYTLTLNGAQVATGGNYGAGETITFNCPAGMSCLSALSVVPGTYSAPTRNFWYSFTPESSGMYFISTCGVNTCDTKLWVYDECPSNISNSNDGTIYYDDNNGGCNDQARVNALMVAGLTYYIRVGDAGGSCTGAINWSLTFNGEISGCMDPLACNFNPIATIPGGECYLPGDPNCPEGRPDLVILENTIKTSMYVAQINASNCHVVENCLTGYGMRDIIRFTTHIKNIGDADYYIGSPSSEPTQFSWGNCHGHWHYEGYAEYILYSGAGAAIPVGFKNGFCVLDLECSDGGAFTYGCSNMGISKQCGDIYGAGLDCQWVDITDVADGQYTMVVRVNWDNAPDALGRYEISHSNNWAQVCINIDRSAGGAPVVTQIEDCASYTDCEGNIFGNSVLDCEGVCGGQRIMGDLNNTGAQETVDARIYVEDILGNDITATFCNDINQDSRITVFDAALVSSCVNFGENHFHAGNVPHDHCNFPSGLYNPSDTVTLQILNVDFVEQYIDIAIVNPTTGVVAYEFSIDGVEIWDVENLAIVEEYPILPEFVIGGDKVIGISYQDSIIRKYSTPTAIARVHYFERTSDTICIREIVDIVSQDFEQVFTRIGGDCFVFDVTGVANFDKANSMQLRPNPANELVSVELEMVDMVNGTLVIHDMMGREVFSQSVQPSYKQRIDVPLNNLANGIYSVNLQTERGRITQKMIVQH